VVPEGVPRWSTITSLTQTLILGPLIRPWSNQPLASSMPTVKRFADQLGGSTDVKSMLGLGTTMILQLPAASTGAEAGMPGH
jgi:hypothetical protein